MVTKAIVTSINRSGNRCKVRMPLFETASSSTPVEAEALISITPGFFNNLFVNDVVFVAFEENAMEYPIIIGKLYKGSSFESETLGGAGIVDAFLVRTKAQTPADDTWFRYKETEKTKYEHFRTPRRIADYILWLESLTKKLFNQLEEHFRCFKNWTQWQLQPENVEVDDGDIDISAEIGPTYQEEGAECKVCDNKNKCTKKNCRTYSKLATDNNYPKV